MPILDLRGALRLLGFCQNPKRGGSRWNGFAGVCRFLRAFSGMEVPGEFSMQLVDFFFPFAHYNGLLFPFAKYFKLLFELHFGLVTQK